MSSLDDAEPEICVDEVEHIADVNSNDKPVEPELLGAIGDVFGGSEAIECHGGVDWDGLQIDDIVDEEGEGCARCNR